MPDGSVLLVDFDNVFTTLWGIDAALAIRFASDPARWLRVLQRAEERPRRWLVARCYMNPSGWVAAYGEQNDRLWFYKFRQFFVQAGFEVIDCPPLTRGAKNGADIRMVIDALDLLDHRTRFDEFVLLTGDSDFTPLLHRLRAEDRRTAVASPGRLASAFASVADSVLGLDQIAALLADAEMSASGTNEAVARAGDDAAADAEREFGALVRRRYSESGKPLNLSALSTEVVGVVPSAKASNWFGNGTFRRALDGLSLPNVRFSQHHLWEDGRHEQPAPPAQPSPREGDGSLEATAP